MIEAKLEKRKQTVMLTVNGHANYGEYGKDIVCAAVSALVLTLGFHLDESDLKSISSGEVVLSSQNPEKELYFHFVFEGIRRLSEIYPENIEVKKQFEV